MSSIKWIIGVPLSIVVVVVLKLSIPPAPRVQQQEQTSNESSFTATDSSGRSTYIEPKVTGTAEKKKFENAAVACWNEYGRKSLSDSDKQQIAFMCEGLDKRAAETR